MSYVMITKLWIGFYRKQNPTIWQLGKNNLSTYGGFALNGKHGEAIAPPKDNGVAAGKVASKINAKKCKGKQCLFNE
jgi:hypothetical protein